LLDRRIVAVAVATPRAEQPGDGAAVGVQVVRELERHESHCSAVETTAMGDRRRPGARAGAVRRTTVAVLAGLVLLAGCRAEPEPRSEPDAKPTASPLESPAGSPVADEALCLVTADRIAEI